MAYNSNNPNGQATTANSAPVTISSNQPKIPVEITGQPELVATGTITTTDIAVAAPSGTGVLLSGTSTAGSYVSALATGGNASVVIGITGLTTGTIYYEGSADSTTGIDGNWIALNMKQAGVVNTQISSSATMNGLYRGNTAGIRYIRMRSVGTLTGTPLITLRLSAGVAGEFLFGSIPTGTNTIGKIGIDQTTPGTTNKVSVGTDGQVSSNGTIFAFSTLNSTTAQLASATIFNGVIESIVTQQSYSILFYSDQGAQIAVSQYIDVSGIKLISNIIYNYVANTQFARSAVANGNYIKISVTNLGASATTVLQLDTAYGTIPSATQLNNSPSAINELNGAVVDTNSGNKSAGTQRIVLATDQPNLTTPLNTSNSNLDVLLSTRLKPSDTLAAVTTVGSVTAITNALPTGTNTIGKIGIDQTTPGTTNKVSIGTDGTVAINTALPNGTNNIGGVKLPDVASAGSLAALNATVITAVNSQGIVAIQITATWVGTISFQGTEDPTGIAAPSTSWFNVNGVASVTGAQVTSTTVNGQFRINSGGYTAVRAIMTVFTSGSATVWSNASVAPSMATLAEPLPTGSNVIGTTSIKGLILGSQSTAFAAAAVGSTAGLDVTAAASATFIIANTVDATAWTGNPVIIFEQSHNNISWALMGVVRNDTGLSSSTHTLPAGTANIEYMFDLAAEGCSFIRARVITGTTLNGMTIIVQPCTMPFSPTVTAILNPETTKVIGTVNTVAGTSNITYSAVSNNIATAALATDIITIYGSATKTINITEISVTGVQTTAGQAQFMLVKRSTANVGGTSTATTKVTYDSNDAAATAVVSAYTANPTTLGTVIGNVRGDRIFLPGTASTSDAQGLNWNFMFGKQMILRGVAQGVCVNLGGVTIAGGSINVTIEWTEV